jgi:hypothetical protein
MLRLKTVVKLLGFLTVVELLGFLTEYVRGGNTLQPGEHEQVRHILGIPPPSQRAPIRRTPSHNFCTHSSA